jgi:Na+-transporting NADH:ubiquinone oxidoreductase subunit F
MNAIAIGTLVFIAMVLSLSMIVLTARKFLLPSQDFSIRVNDSQSVVGHFGQKLLDALTNGGISLPSACAGAGTCGLCRVNVTAGGGEVMATERGRLSRAEIRENKRLACQVTIRSDMAVHVDDALLSVEIWQCTVRSNRSIAPLIKEVVLELPVGCELDFRAGAYVQVTVPAYKLSFTDLDLPSSYESTWERLGLRALSSKNDQPTSRAYSIANTPSERGCIVLNVRLALPPPGHPETPPGVVSSYLFGMRPGSTVNVTGPYGEFAAQQSEREMVFIGGGVGMAPLRAMIFEQLERSHSKRQISFWYGARSSDELFYMDSFARLQHQHSNFRLTVALSEPKAGDAWDGPIGFIHDVVAKQYLDQHPAPEECEYYLCGPPLMIQAVVSMLEDFGVEADSIFNDDFGS